MRRRVTFCNRKRAEWEDKPVIDSCSKKVKRIQRTRKIRKSIGSGERAGGGSDSDDDDDDNDFMPRKKAAAAKALKRIAPAGGASRARGIHGHRSRRRYRLRRLGRRATMRTLGTTSYDARWKRERARPRPPHKPANASRK